MRTTMLRDHDTRHLVLQLHQLFAVFPGDLRAQLLAELLRLLLVQFQALGSIRIEGQVEGQIGLSYGLR